MYLDSRGLIVQKNGDAGDQLQREGFWAEGVEITPVLPPQAPSHTKYSTALTILGAPTLTRSWQPGDATPPWNDPNDTSRDQLVPNIRACGYLGYTKLLRHILWEIIKNFSRYFNGDVAFIQDYARFARAFKAWWLWPFILFGDVFLLGNSIIRCWKGRDYDNVGDDINHIGDLAQAQRILPTPISWLARKIYVWYRPNHFLAAGIPDPGFGAEWALFWYFRETSGGNPEFTQLWTPIVRGF